MLSLGMLRFTILSIYRLSQLYHSGTKWCFGGNINLRKDRAIKCIIHPYEIKFDNNFIRNFTATLLLIRIVRFYASLLLISMKVHKKIN